MFQTFFGKPQLVPFHLELYLLHYLGLRKAKHNKQYKFTLTYENIEYPIIINTKYHKQRKLIKDIKIISDENDTCLNLTVLEQTLHMHLSSPPFHLSHTQKQVEYF